MKGASMELGTFMESVLNEAFEALSKFCNFWEVQTNQKDEDFKKYKDILAWLKKYLNKKASFFEEKSVKPKAQKLSEGIRKFSQLLEKTSKSSFGTFTNRKSSFLEEARKQISELCEDKLDLEATLEILEEE